MPSAKSICKQTNKDISMSALENMLPVDMPPHNTDRRMSPETQVVTKRGMPRSMSPHIRKANSLTSVEDLPPCLTLRPATSNKDDSMSPASRQATSNSPLCLSPANFFRFKSIQALCDLNHSLLNPFQNDTF